jgi:hypothetical protein
VFQDFFYQWSATMTAAAQLLAEQGFVRFERSAASSMVATVLRTPTTADLLEFDLAFGEAAPPELLDRAIQAVKPLPIDRPEVFIPRLRLAKAQYLWDQGEHASAQQSIALMIQEAGGRLPPALFADMMELMRFGFSLRRLYELDHSA